MYKSLLKPFFFRFSPERAHHITLSLFNFGLSVPGVGALLRRMYRYKHPALRRELFGLTFENPVGLAAGFDKDGKHYKTMANLGFGFIEVGTVTPKGQDGNPQPRLFRLPADEGLINRMGFNNDGVEALVERLKRYGKPKGVIIGGNIGKNKVTPNEQAADDYVKCFEALFPYVDYFVVNVSSPNTPNLRDLQEKEPLSKLLQLLQDLNRAKPAPKPLLLKIAPDLTDGQLDDILDIVGDEAKLGKTSGIDVAQGRGFTSAYQNGGDVAVAEAPTSTDGEDIMESIKRKLLKGNSLAEAQQQANMLVAAAISELDVLPPSAARDELVSLAQMVIDRDH